MVNQTYLRECFSYDPDTGVMVWKVRPRHHFRTDRGWRCFNANDAGKPVGAKKDNGYLLVCVSGHKYYVHRLIWVYMTGELPSQSIDHKNTDRADNRWCNLRVATRNEQSANTRRCRNNTSGVKGVSFHKASSKWSAYVNTNDKRVYLGLFETLRAAGDAVCAARKELHGEFARNA